MRRYRVIDSANGENRFEIASTPREAAENYTRTDCYLMDDAGDTKKYTTSHSGQIITVILEHRSGGGSQ